jgi:hypothetical protein
MFLNNNHREQQEMVDERSHVQSTGVLLFASLLFTTVLVSNFKDTVYNSFFSISSTGVLLISESKNLRLAESKGSDDHLLTGHENRVHPAHTPFYFMPIPLNSASGDLLSTIPGIGSKTAAQIIEFRAREGRVENLDKLLDVKGIGSEKLALIKPYLTVR